MFRKDKHRRRKLCGGRRIMEWGDLKVEDIRSVLLHCANCGVITVAPKSNGFACEHCGKNALVLEGEA